MTLIYLVLLLNIEMTSHTHRIKTFVFTTPRTQCAIITLFVYAKFLLSAYPLPVHRSPHCPHSNLPPLVTAVRPHGLYSLQRCSANLAFSLLLRAQSKQHRIGRSMCTTSIPTFFTAEREREREKQKKKKKWCQQQQPTIQKREREKKSYQRFRDWIHSTVLTRLKKNCLSVNDATASQKGSTLPRRGKNALRNQSLHRTLPRCLKLKRGARAFQEQKLGFVL